jgi:hypothetical protein
MRSNRNGMRWILSGVFVTLLLASWNPAAAAKPSRDNTLDVIVVADLGTLDVVPSANGGPFYVGGIIQDLEGQQIGVFHCLGFFFAGGGVVDQEYDFFDRGKIVLTGVEDEGPRAITGGTGEFRNVRGEAFGFDFNSFPEFPVTFNLIGADG